MLLLTWNVSSGITARRPPVGVDDPLLSSPPLPILLVVDGACLSLISTLAELPLESILAEKKVKDLSIQPGDHVKDNEPRLGFEDRSRGLVEQCFELGEHGGSIFAMMEELQL
jgi:hypothetical protein